MRREPTEHAAMMIGACDSREARVLLVRSAWPDRLHVEELRRLSNRWLDFHDRGRPIMLGRGPSANAVQRYADEHREPLEQSRRFARDVAAWIERQRADARAAGGAAGSAQPVPVFAAPRFLGHLRQAFGGVDGRVDLRVGELRTMSEAQLSRHPEIDALVRRACAGPALLAPARSESSTVSGAD